LADVEGANVVEALDVIGVAVGEKNGCEAIEAGGEGLGAKSGVVSMTTFWPLRERRMEGRRRFVVRIGGLADGTVAADGGDSHGGAGTETVRWMGDEDMGIFYGG